MQNNNWKNKLEDEAELEPVDAGGTEAVWEKLHARLRQPGRRKIFWIWTAAACLITAGCLTVMVVVQQSSPGIQRTAILPALTPVRIKSDQPKIEPAGKIIVATAVVATPVLAILPPKKVHGRPLQTVTVVPVHAVVASPWKIDSNQQTQPAPLPVYSTSVINETASAPAPGTQKPVLKVVHINELGNDNNKNSNAREPGDYSAIQFGINNRQPVNKAAIPSLKITLRFSKDKPTASN